MSRFIKQGIGSTTRGVGMLALGGTQIALGVVVSGLRLGIRRTQRFPQLPELPEGRMLDLPGRGRVFVVDSGEPFPGAPTVVLLHGLATTATLCWYGVLADLAPHCRIVMADQRWHGRGIVSERFSLEECADDVAATLDVLDIDRAVVVGYSMGGALAQVIAGRHPERLAGLVLCSTAARWHASTIERVFYAGLGRANLKLRPHARARVANRLAALPEVPIVVTPGSDLSDWAWAEFRSTSAWSLVEALDELGRFDARGWLPDAPPPPRSSSPLATGRLPRLASARWRRSFPMRASTIRPAGTPRSCSMPRGGRSSSTP